MKFVPYLPEHFTQIAEKSLEKYVTGNVEVTAQSHCYYPSTTVTTDDGDVLACFGVTPLWENVATVWVIFSEDIKKYGMQTYRGTKAFFEQQLKSNFHRIECYVIEGNDKARKFIETFGFTCEAEMKKYTPDARTAYLYSRVRDE